MLSLQIGGASYRSRTRKLVVQQNRIGIVHNSELPLPKTRAVIRLFVIRRFERFIESFEIFPDFPGCEQKRAGAVIDIPPEHVHRRKRIVAPTVTKARTIAPDDA